MTEEIGVRLFGRDWFIRLKETLNSPEFEALGKFLSSERVKYTIYPEKENVFKAFRECPFDSVRIIILGQDPYVTDGMATGLAFANPNDKLVPQPSLRQIFAEITNDVYKGFDFDNIPSLNLLQWAHQGVLLLNTSLTVRKNESNSHSKQWEFFTKAVVKALNDGNTGLVWMLWGNNAKGYKGLIDASTHHILEAGHPATVCYGKDTFSGCKHFSKANFLLNSMNGENSQIKW
jgi:uracil-DNA glycosylase